MLNLETMSSVKLKSFLISGRGKSTSRERLDVVQTKLNVNEEYLNALRTKSFTDIWDKVHGEQNRSSSTAILERRSSNLSPLLLPAYSQISEHLLEPRQDILTDMLKTADLHHLLIDFFNGNLEACRICGNLLQSIDRTRADYRIIQNIIRLTTNLPDSSSSSSFSNEYSSNCTNDQCRIIFGKLALFAKLENPLSNSNLLQLNTLRNQCVLMLDRLNMKRKGIARRLRLIRFCDKTWKTLLIVACGALAAATLALGAHGLVGVIAAAPGFLTTLCNIPLMCIRRSSLGLKNRRNLARLGAQLDTAARGVFILNQDFGTMDRLVMRLRDEIEHLKSIAGLGLRNRRRQMLKEVVKEFETHESSFLDQLDELEEHVYLCFLTINRARRLVIQEILVQQTTYHDQATSSN